MAHDVSIPRHTASDPVASASRDLPRLAVIIGSTRQGRFADKVAGWFTTEVRRHGTFVPDVIDLAEADLPAAYPAEMPPPVLAFRRRLEAADAFVVITPEYNHSFPAPLKQAIDLARAEWKAKPVGFVSYGGRSGGIRAVEQLRQIFAELHVASVRDGVVFPDIWERFGADGLPADKPGSARAAGTMLDQLAWWALALRYARDFMPYGLGAA